MGSHDDHVHTIILHIARFPEVTLQTMQYKNQKHIVLYRQQAILGRFQV